MNPLMERWMKSSLLWWVGYKMQRVSNDQNQHFVTINEIFLFFVTLNFIIMFLIRIKSCLRDSSCQNDFWFRTIVNWSTRDIFNQKQTSPGLLSLIIQRDKNKDQFQRKIYNKNISHFVVKTVNGKYPK